MRVEEEDSRGKHRDVEVLDINLYLLRVGINQGDGCELGDIPARLVELRNRDRRRGDSDLR